MTPTAASVYDQWETGFAALGYRPSNATICPLAASGRRCRSWREDEPCICQRHHRVLDHARVWLDDRGRHVFTAEPYDAGSDELVALITDLHREGLEATFTGRSPWNPGSTFLIIIELPTDTPKFTTSRGIALQPTVVNHA